MSPSVSIHSVPSPACWSQRSLNYLSRLIWVNISLTNKDANLRHQTHWKAGLGQILLANVFFFLLWWNGCVGFDTYFLLESHRNTTNVKNSIRIHIVLVTTYKALFQTHQSNTPAMLKNRRIQIPTVWS